MAVRCNADIVRDVRRRDQPFIAAELPLLGLASDHDRFRYASFESTTAVLSEHDVTAHFLVLRPALFVTIAVIDQGLRPDDRRRGDCALGRAATFRARRIRRREAWRVPLELAVYSAGVYVRQGYSPEPADFFAWPLKKSATSAPKKTFFPIAAEMRA